MSIKAIVYGLTLGGVGYYIYSASNEPLINDGESGTFDSIFTDLQGGFMQVSNFSGLNMGVSIPLLGYLKGWEKFSPVPYFATAYEKALNKKTIGYGHVIKDGENLTFLTEQEATNLLLQDVAGAEDAVNKYCKVPLTQNQFDALVSLAFNCGNGAAIKVIARINRGDFEGVPAHIMRYVYQGKTVLNGLVNRRKKDVAIWSNGVYQS